MDRFVVDVGSEVAGWPVVDGAVVSLGAAVEVGEVVTGGVGAGLDAGGRVADESSFPPHAAIARNPISSATVLIAEV